MLIVLSVSAVSAAEADNTTSNEIMMISDSLPDSTIQSNSNVNVSVQAEGDGTFTELSSQIEVASADSTLYLDKDYYWDGEGNYSGIVLDKTITIDGQGHTIDAESYDGGHVRIFNSYGTDIVLKNIVFANADMNYGTVGGGAIYVNEGATTSIVNCTFANNTAGFGGAINSYGGLNVTNCTFYNNSVRYNGGAIIGSADTPGYMGAYLNVNNSRFYNNSAAFGGAILGGYESKVSISNSRFINNSANNNGGALDFTTFGSVTAVTNCTFINNTAANGGVVYFATAAPVVVFDNCLIVNNTATSNGGVLFANDDSPFTSIYDVTFNNCNIMGNEATTGGIAYTEPNLVGTNVTIIDSNVANNTADSAAIAYMNDGSKLSIINSNVVNNTADDGIAYYNNGTSYLAITNFTDLANAISNADDEVVLVQNVAMSDSEATTYANGILINKDITINGNGYTIDARNLARIFNIASGVTVTLQNVNLVNGQATQGGAINNNGRLNINNVNLTDNTATYWGGAVYNDGTLTVTGSNFDGNDVTARTTSPGSDPNYGGAAIFNSNNGALTIDDSSFTNNLNNYVNGNDVAGAVNSYNDVTITNSYFENNYGRYGGAVSVLGDGSTELNVDNCTFVDNGGLYGAGIIALDTVFSITDSTFENNTAFGAGSMSPNENNGGAICIYGYTTGVIDNSTFIGNDAQYGGAISFSQNQGIVIANSTFINNTADWGGAVSLDSAISLSNNVTVVNSTFIGNDAGQGGAIYNYEELNVTDSVFTNNTAEIGSAVLNYNGCFEL